MSSGGAILVVNYLRIRSSSAHCSTNAMASAVESQLAYRQPVLTVLAKRVGAVLIGGGVHLIHGHRLPIAGHHGRSTAPTVSM